MFEEILIPLQLIDALGRITGKTRFQKLIFLIQKEAEREGIEGLKIEYGIHYYGPFSSELASTIENLSLRGFIQENAEMTPSGYMRCDYRLTDKGRELLHNAIEKGAISPELRRIVQKIADDYGELPLPQLVQEAYRQY